MPGGVHHGSELHSSLRGAAESRWVGSAPEKVVVAALSGLAMIVGCKRVKAVVCVSVFLCVDSSAKFLTRWYLLKVGYASGRLRLFDNVIFCVSVLMGNGIESPVAITFSFCS